MDMQGSRLLTITQQQAWDALNDPAVLKACIPGCEKVEAAGENQYAIGMAIKIGPVSAKFAGKITLNDIVPPASYTLLFEGQGGAAGFGKGNAAVTLTPQATGCELHYTVHASVGGKIAQLGQRLIDGAAKSLAEDFFKRFEDAMQAAHPAAPSAQVANTLEQVAPVSAPGKAKVPVWVWLGGAAAAGFALWLLKS